MEFQKENVVNFYQKNNATKVDRDKKKNTEYDTFSKNLHKHDNFSVLTLVLIYRFF